MTDERTRPRDRDDDRTSRPGGLEGVEPEDVEAANFERSPFRGAPDLDDQYSGGVAGGTGPPVGHSGGGGRRAEGGGAGDAGLGDITGSSAGADLAEGTGRPGEVADPSAADLHDNT